MELCFYCLAWRFTVNVLTCIEGNRVVIEGPLSERLWTQSRYSRFLSLVLMGYLFPFLILRHELDMVIQGIAENMYNLCLFSWYAHTQFRKAINYSSKLTLALVLTTSSSRSNFDKECKLRSLEELAAYLIAYFLVIYQVIAVVILSFCPVGRWKVRERYCVMLSSSRTTHEANVLNAVSLWLSRHCIISSLRDRTILMHVVSWLFSSIV